MKSSSDLAFLTSASESLTIGFSYDLCDVRESILVIKTWYPVDVKFSSSKN